MEFKDLVNGHTFKGGKVTQLDFYYGTDYSGREKKYSAKISSEKIDL